MINEKSIVRYLGFAHLFAEKLRFSERLLKNCAAMPLFSLRPCGGIAAEIVLRFIGKAELFRK